MILLFLENSNTGYRKIWNERTGGKCKVYVNCVSCDSSSVVRRNSLSSRDVWLRQLQHAAVVIYFQTIELFMITYLLTL